MVTRTRFVVLVLLALSFSAGGVVFADKKQAVEEIPYDALRRFTDVFAQIKAYYVEEMDDEVLLKNAIRGMLEGLDPHSSYLEKSEFKGLRESTSGEFGGLGIEVTMENGFVKVVSPIDDTPAQRGGIQPGDLIIRLDDKPVKGMSLNEAVTAMRGKPGTRIELTIVRETEDAPFKVVLERDTIHVKSVRSEILEPGYGYVRLSTFQNRTGADLLQAIDKLKKKEKGALNGLILDLRNNPGGVLSAARDVADAFLEDGLIVYTEGRTGDADMKYNATPGDILNGAPLVVLVNGGSASASEIVAGAIQDQVRGIVMGATTFGKASVQTIVELDGESAIKLTTARYYTPKGRSIQAEGIVPDIKLARARVELLERDDAVDPVKESSLSGHLNNPNGKPSGSGKDNADKKPSLAARDYELFEALNLLKGLNLLGLKGR